VIACTVGRAVLSSAIFPTFCFIASGGDEKHHGNHLGDHVWYLLHGSV
jgi:hypothetical protein